VLVLVLLLALLLRAGRAVAAPTAAAGLAGAAGAPGLLLLLQAQRRQSLAAVFRRRAVRSCLRLHLHLLLLGLGLLRPRQSPPWRSQAAPPLPPRELLLQGPS
jgi:hypothetical protein